jgi:hypothetical protein
MGLFDGGMFDDVKKNLVGGLFGDQKGMDPTESWKTGTTYTPESGAGGAFKFNTDGQVAGLSGKGQNGVADGLKLAGRAVDQAQGGAYAQALAGIKTSQELAQPQAAPQGAFGQPQQPPHPQPQVSPLLAFLKRQNGG